MANQKCACSDCVCTVDTSSALEKDGQFYCSENCVNHTGEGCGHQGCNCKG